MRDDFGGLFAASALLRRDPTSQEVAGGIPCGPFSQPLLNELFFAESSMLSELNAILDAAGIAPDETQTTQLLAALRAIFAPSATVAALSTSLRNLVGSAAANSRTASFTAEQLIAGVSGTGASYRGNALTLSFNGATVGVNGMDSGSTPISGDLSIYAIYNPTTQIWATLGCAGSTSRGTFYTGASLPAGFTASVLIWTGVTDSSGNFQPFRQLDRTIEIQHYSMGSSFNSPAPSFASVGSLAPVVPFNARTWLPEGQQMSTGAAANVYIAPTAAGVGSVGMISIWSTTNNARGSGAPVQLVVPQTAYQATTQSQTWQIWVRGYTF